MTQCTEYRRKVMTHCTEYGRKVMTHCTGYGRTFENSHTSRIFTKIFKNLWCLGNEFGPLRYFERNVYSFYNWKQNCATLFIWSFKSKYFSNFVWIANSIFFRPLLNFLCSVFPGKVLNQKTHYIIACYKLLIKQLIIHNYSFFHLQLNKSYPNNEEIINDANILRLINQCL